MEEDKTLKGLFEKIDIKYDEPDFQRLVVQKINKKKLLIKKRNQFRNQAKVGAATLILMCLAYLFSITFSETTFEKYSDFWILLIPFYMLAILFIQLGEYDSIKSNKPLENQLS